MDKPLTATDIIEARSRPPRPSKVRSRGIDDSLRPMVILALRALLRARRRRLKERGIL